MTIPDNRRLIAVDAEKEPELIPGDMVKFEFKKPIIMPFTMLPLKISPFCEVLEVHDGHILVDITRIIGIYEYDPKRAQLYDLENPFAVSKERIIEIVRDEHVSGG